jgi:predicted transcriptional regulator
MGKLSVNTPLHDAIKQGAKDSGMEGNNVNVFVSRDKAKYKNEEFLHLFRDKSAEVLKDMKPATVKVYSWFLICANYGNFVECVIDEIVGWVGISKRSVIKALNELNEKQVIIKYKNPNDTRNNYYIINPHMAWKGKVEDRKRSIKILKDNRQMTLPFWNKEVETQNQNSPKPTLAIKKASDVIIELNNRKFKSA